MPPWLIGFLHRNDDIVLLALAAAALVLLLGLGLALVRLGRLQRVYRRLTRGTSGGNLEEILQDYMQVVRDVEARYGALDSRVGALADAQRLCLQKVGVVRFNAFEDVGGEQSFAVVMLDGRGSGVALSSVFSRSDVRVYCKAIDQGRPCHPLSSEEARALTAAGAR